MTDTGDAEERRQLLGASGFRGPRAIYRGMSRSREVCLAVEPEHFPRYLRGAACICAVAWRTDRVGDGLSPTLRRFDDRYVA